MRRGTSGAGKRCSRCGEFKALDRFDWHERKGAWYSHCRECRVKINRYREEHWKQGAADCEARELKRTRKQAERMTLEEMAQEAGCRPDELLALGKALWAAWDLCA